MPRIPLFILALSLGTIAHSAAAEKTGAEKEGAAPAGSRPPEYAVLDKFIGTWKAQVEVISADGKKSAQSWRNTFAWDLNGRFLKDEGREAGGAASFLGLWSFDPQAKRYQSWYFQGPGGEASHLLYAWDEAKQTITGTQDLGGGMTLEATDHFIDRDHYEWGVLVKDKDGRPLNRMSARSVRVAQSAGR